MLLFGGSSVVVVRNCELTNNIAYSGGAISLWHESTLVIENSEFHHNQATLGDGGAIHMRRLGKSASVTDSWFTRNSAGNTGGTLFFENGVPATVTNSIFRNNSASEGGAIPTWSGSSLAVSMCTFESNKVGLSFCCDNSFTSLGRSPRWCYSFDVSQSPELHRRLALPVQHGWSNRRQRRWRYFCPRNEGDHHKL